MWSQILFAACLVAGIGLFVRRVMFIRQNILMGQPMNRSDQPLQRWKVMARVALGQGKMMTRPVAGFMHVLIYVGFVIINVELLEIVLTASLEVTDCSLHLLRCIQYSLLPSNCLLDWWCWRVSSSSFVEM